MEMKKFNREAMTEAQRRTCYGICDWGAMGCGINPNECEKLKEA